MTTSVDELAMRREAEAIQDRRSDVIRRGDDRRAAAKAAHPATVSKSVPSHAALLHRVASFITTEALPPARVTVTMAAEVLVDATGEALVENVVRRWCAALGLVVTEAPGECNGFASVTWSGSGYSDGLWWMVEGRELLPTQVVDRFGVGIGPSC